MHIESLDFSDKKLTEFPMEICTHPKLKKLTLSASSAWRIFPPLSALPWKMKNPIVPHLPDGLGKLTELEEIYLAGLGIKSLPPSFFNLKKLQIIDLSFNGELSVGEYQQEFADLIHLKYLNIAGCLEDSFDPESLKVKSPDLHIFTTQDLINGAI